MVSLLSCIKASCKTIFWFLFLLILHVWFLFSIKWSILFLHKWLQDRTFTWLSTNVMFVCSYVTKKSLLKICSKNYIDVAMTYFLLNLNIFHTLFNVHIVNSVIHNFFTFTLPGCLILYLYLWKNMCHVHYSYELFMYTFYMYLVQLYRGFE